MAQKLKLTQSLFSLWWWQARTFSCLCLNQLGKHLIVYFDCLSFWKFLSLVPKARLAYAKPSPFIRGHWKNSFLNCDVIISTDWQCRHIKAESVGFVKQIISAGNREVVITTKTLTVIICGRPQLLAFLIWLVQSQRSLQWLLQRIPILPRENCLHTSFHPHSCPRSLRYPDHLKNACLNIQEHLFWSLEEVFWIP